MTQADDKQTVQRGLFITFEGIERCGKSTQTKLLAEWCRKKGYDCIATREPGGTPLGERLREIVLDSAFAVEPLAELFLFLAARVQHIHDVIEPALSRGQWVICDRFADSTLAYQSCGRGLSDDLLLDLNSRATRDLAPDITFVLQMNSHDGLDPSQRQRELFDDRIEADSRQFHERVLRGFLEIAKKEPERVKIVSPGNIKQVHTTVLKYLKDCLKERNR